MPIIDLHEKPFDSETKTKLELFEDYLEEWLPVFSKRGIYKHAIICDFFAGVGKDSNNVDGSPLRILNKIDYLRNEIDSNFKITIILNEYNPNKYEELKKVVHNKISNSKLESIVKVEYYNEDFTKLFHMLQNRLSKEPCFMFLDQNGIKHVTQDIIHRLESFLMTDFLFFISSSYLIRFAGEPSFKKYHPNLPVEKLTQGSYTNIHQNVLEYYRGLLSEESRTKLYPFTIKKVGNIYGLIFGSKHPLGIDKFLRVAWKKNGINGNANFDIDNDNEINDSLFAEVEGFKQVTKIEKFKQNLKAFIFEQTTTTNKELYDYTIEAGHIHPHAVALMKELKKKGIIHFDRSPKISYDYCYNKSKLEEIIFEVNSNEIEK